MSPQFKEEQRQKVIVLQPQAQPQVQIKLPTEPDKSVAEMLHKKRQRKSENNNNEGEEEKTTAFSTPMSRPPSLQLLLQVGNAVHCFICTGANRQKPVSDPINV